VAVPSERLFGDTVLFDKIVAIPLKVVGELAEVMDCRKERDESHHIAFGGAKPSRKLLSKAMVTLQISARYRCDIKGMEDQRMKRRERTVVKGLAPISKEPSGRGFGRINWLRHCVHFPHKCWIYSSQEKQHAAFTPSA